MKNHMTLFGSVVMGLALCIAVALWARPMNVRALEPSVPSTPATTALPEPACIHQNCFERPAHLYCRRGSSPYCDDYLIAYEHHCDCDRWGP
jgi:hypothetical protein